MENQYNFCFEFDKVCISFDCVKGLAYVLWESMAEGANEVNEDHTNASYLLYTQLEECVKNLRNVQKKLMNCTEKQLISKTLKQG